MHCVITGVTRGLGRALAVRLIDMGHTVSGCGRSEPAIRELAGQYEAPHRFDRVDVSDDAAVRQWAEAVVSRQGAPERLINNAALINRNAPLWEVPVDEFSRVIDVNIKGVFHVTRAFLPAMIQAAQGIVINLSSGWGRVAAADVAPYCATKWGIEGLTQSLAMDLPDGLAAIPVNPGIINTEMLQSCFGQHASGFPTAEAWAAQAAPLVIELSLDQNGQSLTVPAPTPT